METIYWYAPKEHFITGLQIVAIISFSAGYAIARTKKEQIIGLIKRVFQ